MGAQLLKEVAIKTNDIAGDGTTTATVLARAMLDEGLRNLAAGAPPNELRRGMMAACDAAVASIRARSHPVKGGDDILRVATISSGDDGDRRDDRRRLRQGGQGRRRLGRGRHRHRDRGRGRRGHAIRPRVHLRAPGHRPAEHGIRPVDARVLVTDAKISSVADLLPSLELVDARGTSAPDRRRGRPGRGARRPWSSTAPAAPSARWRSKLPLSGSGARPCSRTSRCSPARPSSARRPVCASTPSRDDQLGVAGRVDRHQGRHHHRARRRIRRPPSRAAARRSASRWRRPRPTGTARSSRSGSRA